MALPKGIVFKHSGNMFSFDNLAPRLLNFLMLNSTEHEIQLIVKIKCGKIITSLGFKLSGGVFFMLINVKMPTIVGILTFMSMIHLLLS